MTAVEKATDAGNLLLYIRRRLSGRPIRLSQAQLFQLPSNRFKEQINWAPIPYYLLSHLQDYSSFLLLVESKKMVVSFRNCCLSLLTQKTYCIFFYRVIITYFFLPIEKILILFSTMNLNKFHISSSSGKNTCGTKIDLKILLT